METEQNAESVAARLEAEVIRGTIFEQYPPVRPLASAIEIALERIEEWDYFTDPHGWCHERPVLITLVAAAIKYAARNDGEE